MPKQHLKYLIFNTTVLRSNNDDSDTPSPKDLTTLSRAPWLGMVGISARDRG